MKQRSQDPTGHSRGSKNRALIRCYWTCGEKANENSNLHLDGIINEKAISKKISFMASSMGNKLFFLIQFISCLKLYDCYYHLTYFVKTFEIFHCVFSFVLAVISPKDHLYCAVTKV